MGEEVKAVEAKGLSYGVENIIKLVKFGDALEKAVKGAKADGKIDAKDLGQLFPLVPLVEPLVGGAGQIPKELKDLSAAELDIVVAEVSKLEGIGSKVEVLQKIRASLKFAHAGYDLYNAFAKKA